MRTLGPGSLASFLKLLLDILYFVLWALLGLSSLIIVVIMVSGIAQITGMGPSLHPQMTRLMEADFLVALPMSILGLVAVTFVVDRLRRIFNTLIMGDPFVPENARHLRAISFAIAAFQLIYYAAHGVIALMFTLFGFRVASGSEIAPNFSLNLGVWFAVLALFVLAEVFREGARLRAEQKLTI